MHAATREGGREGGTGVGGEAMETKQSCLSRVQIMLLTAEPSKSE